MDYAQVCRAGDVLLFEHPEGVGAISKLIRLTQGNKKVHCALVVRNASGLVEVAEINSNYRLRLVPIEISARMEAPQIVRHPTLVVDEHKLYECTKPLVGASYAYERIFDALLNHMLGYLGIAPRAYLSSENPKRFICSTLTGFLLSCASDWQYNPVAEPDDFAAAPWAQIFPQL